MTKHEARSIFQARRKDLTKSEVTNRSSLISGLFFEHFDLSNIQFLHCFLPIRSRNEPDTWMIIDKVRRAFPSISIVLPKVTGDDGQMQSYPFAGEMNLSRNRWGIEEPAGDVPIDAALVDMILVPLLAFDVLGNRVGYGRGFYDRLLQMCRPDAIRIGISLFDAIDRIDDVDAYDEKLHYCITPNKVFTFKPPVPVG